MPIFFMLPLIILGGNARGRARRDQEKAERSIAFGQVFSS
jgi:hypothetical protein